MVCQPRGLETEKSEWIGTRIAEMRQSLRTDPECFENCWWIWTGPSKGLIGSCFRLEKNPRNQSCKKLQKFAWFWGVVYSLRQWWLPGRKSWSWVGPLAGDICSQSCITNDLILICNIFFCPAFQRSPINAIVFDERFRRGGYKPAAQLFSVHVLLCERVLRTNEPDFSASLLHRLCKKSKNA